MPIYEYKCLSCGHKFEKIQKITDDPLQTCPNCQEDQLQKLISAAGFRLKGGGWYETDFKSSNEKKRNLADSSSDKGTETKSQESAPTGSKSSSVSDV